MHTAPRQGAGPGVGLRGLLVTKPKVRHSFHRARADAELDCCASRQPHPRLPGCWLGPHLLTPRSIWRPPMLRPVHRPMQPRMRRPTRQRPTAATKAHRCRKSWDSERRAGVGQRGAHVPWR